MGELLHHRSIDRMTVKVQPPSPKPEQPPPTAPAPIEEIRLKFFVVIECSHFLVSNNNTRTLTRRHKSNKVSLAAHQVPIQVFNHGHRALHRYLSSKFPMFQNVPVVNLHTITYEIIAKWAEIKQQNNNLPVLVGKVLPLTVTLRLWSVVTRYERRPDIFMVPTSDSAVEEMVKGVKIEEVDDHKSCVICMEEMKNITRKEGNGEVILLQMPCLHVFHEQCIKKWLKISHYCPICRFQMPTDHSS